MRWSASRIIPAVLFSLFFMRIFRSSGYRRFWMRPRQRKRRKIPTGDNGCGRGRQDGVCAKLPGLSRQDGTGHGQRAIAGGWETEGVSQGEIFWFITKGDKDNGMPSWAALPEQKRWQIITYVEAMASGKAGAGACSAPAPKSPGPRLKILRRIRLSPTSDMRSRG